MRAGGDFDDLEEGGVDDTSDSRWQTTGAAIIGGRGGRVPPKNFGWGDANASIPPTIATFSHVVPPTV